LRLIFNDYFLLTTSCYLFSSAGYTVNKRRSALAAHTVNNEHACLPSGLALLTLSF